ncbi:Heavy metal-associated domain containing protein [Quillaja saponaria]|uniref:Heavy metal-associated domain containing protein n=1 Tax=Quillaja saponaria TaxID=32244 RepID=A0AAD7LAF6_QUISA|nr:Heavy metal-associated domain containing protein [Quillaja saponaria]
MTKEADFKLLKIQTCVLKVNIHCDGCKQKVKKLLQRIEGVYQVHIDAEQQKVTVSGSVDSATLIKKLIRAGKYAEIWSSQKPNQNQNQKNICIKDDKTKGQKQGMVQGLEAFKNQNQQKFPTFSSEEDDDYYNDDYEADEEDELRFIREKANQLNFLRQQAIDSNNGNKGVGAIATAPNNAKMNNYAGNGNAGKKGIPNQNIQMKAIPGGIDQKTMAALNMNNPNFGGGNVNLAEVKRENDIGTMMNLAGFNGNGANAASATVLGGNSNGLGGFQVQPNNGYPGSSTGLPSAGLATGQYPSSLMMNMNGYNHPSPTITNMNMQNRDAIQQQPQMLYNRSPFIPPTTGYYYNYNPSSYYYPEPNAYGRDRSASHVLGNDNTDSCSIM